MRTNIEIDDGLIAEAMRRGGHPTRKAAVEEGLSLLVGLARQREAAQALWGLELDWSLEGPARRRPA
jgi:Arc/MetJ family transcription regulator